MVINTEREDSYVKKLFKGLRKQYEDKGKSGGRKEIKRVNPTNSQDIGLLETYKWQCDICEKPVKARPEIFERHHIDGNRENPAISNFVLLCADCHETVHSKARRLMDEYKRTHPQEKTPEKGRGKKKKPPGRPLKCAFCGGTGRDPIMFGAPCRVCDGKGRVPSDRKKKCAFCTNNPGRDPIMFGAPCRVCAGWGYIK